jgi:hypothetical protein
MARMEVSPTKTHVIVFPESAPAELQDQLSYNGTTLEVVSQSRHLVV